MKPCTLKASWFPAVLAVSLCALFAAPGWVAGAGVINGGFETGTLEGWTISLPGDVWVSRERDGVYESGVLYPYESTTIPWLAGFVARVNSPGFEGTFQLRLTGMYGCPPFHPPYTWTMDDGWTYGLDGGDYTLRLEQSIHLSGSMLTISGWANYGHWCDVVLPGGGHNPVAISVNGSAVWSHNTYTVPYDPEIGRLSTSGWEAWTFTAPAEGDYTLTLDVGPVCQNLAYVELDGVQVVPEPAVGSLALLGAGVLLLRRNRK